MDALRASLEQAGNGRSKPKSSNGGKKKSGAKKKSRAKAKA